jgi:hypothetical protein
VVAANLALGHRRRDLFQPSDFFEAAALLDFCLRLDAEHGYDCALVRLLHAARLSAAYSSVSSYARKNMAPISYLSYPTSVFPTTIFLAAARAL